MRIRGAASPPPTPRSGGLIADWTPFALLAAVLLLPPLVAYLIPGVGFIGGVMLASALLLGGSLAGLVRYPAQIRVSDVSLVLGIFATLVIAHFTVALFARAALTAKFGSSLGLLLIEATAIPALVGGVFVHAHDRALWRAGRVLRWVFLASAILGILGLSPPTDSVGAKPLFPFTEPSYWGFTFAPVLIFSSVRSGPSARLAWLLAFLVVTILVQNWTMLLCCLVAIAASLPNWAAIPAALIAFFGLFGVDLSYYAEHLNFNISTSESQSALVYVQGWQMLDESLRNSHWWGLGFQQMGYQYTAVPATFRINAIWGTDINLQDGGFLLSKLGSEFGLIGILVCTVFLVMAVRAFIALRVNLSHPRLNDQELLAYSSCLGITIELLVRGGNYFSGTLMLYGASLLYLLVVRARVRSDAVTDRARIVYG